MHVPPMDNYNNDVNSMSTDTDHREITRRNYREIVDR